LNGDGIPDLVGTNNGVSGPHTVTVLLGNGDGTFQAGTSYPAGVSPDSVAVGDFNGDGIPDLVVGNNYTHTVDVLLGNGDGSFQAPVSYDVGQGGYVYSVAVADFNGDSIPDLAVASGGGVSVLQGNGDGTFQPPQVYPLQFGIGYQGLAIGDFNGDGAVDILTKSAQLLLGNGDGTFQGPIDLGFGNHVGIVAGDFNGDGNLDLAVSAGSVLVLLGNGDGTFQAPIPYGSAGPSMAVGDFNGDGIPDLVTEGDEGTVSVLLGNGDGSFQSALNYPAGYIPVSVAVGDFNGDGFPDVAVGNGYPSNTVSVLLNAADWGAGTPAPPSRDRPPAFHPAAHSSLLKKAPESQKTQGFWPVIPVFEQADSRSLLDPVFAELLTSQPQGALPSSVVSSEGPVAPAKQIAPMIASGQPSRPEVSPTPFPIVTARHAGDAVFEGWSDPLADVLAAGGLT
jgi:hypothetical protein